MAGNDNRDEAEVLPFRTVSDYNIFVESSERRELLEKFENNGFLEYFRTHRSDIPDSTNSAQRKQYFDIDDFNFNICDKKAGLKLCHLNVRRIAKNRGKFLAFLSTLKCDFDVICLTEVGDNANCFLNNQFLPGYSVASKDLPVNNKYGGTAILVKNNFGTITPRDDLQFRLDCKCTDCVVENSWIELDTGPNKYLISTLL